MLAVVRLARLPLLLRLVSDVLLSSRAGRAFLPEPPLARAMTVTVLLSLAALLVRRWL